MNQKHTARIAAAAIRAVKLEKSYNRLIVQMPGKARSPELAREWQKVARARRDLTDSVEAITKGRRE